MAIKQPRHVAGNSFPSTAEVKEVCVTKPPPSQSAWHGALLSARAISYFTTLKN
jgi:hypothetical protein